MNPVSKKEAENIFKAIKKGVKGTKAEVVVCPPFVYLALRSFSEGGLALGAQNCFYEDKGTFTGKVSVLMLKDLGVEYVIIGHSEIRKLGETDEIVNKKIKKALEIGLKVIFCIGETAEERDAGKTNEVLERQLKIGLDGISNFKFQISNLAVAYEPVWAISGGDPYKTKELPTAEKVEKTHSYIRSLLAEMYGKEAAEKVRIIYGGSSNAGNAKDFLENGKAQGFLVGGASLNAEEFSKIVKSAE
jgi:triosephosphate isomerase